MNYKLLTFLFTFYLIVIFLQKEKYYWFYPSLPLYPNNKKDSKITAYYTQKRSDHDIDFFKLTDPSVSYAFARFVPENIDTLDALFQPITKYILLLKYLFNRARPHQVNKNVKLLESKTANTPAYPSGHTAQAYYLAKQLEKKYPHLRNQLYECAEKCAKARIDAGLHYESDNDFSKYIVFTFF